MKTQNKDADTSLTNLEAVSAMVTDGPSAYSPCMNSKIDYCVPGVYPATYLDLPVFGHTK